MPRLLEAPAVEIELTPAQMRHAVSTEAFDGYACNGSLREKRRSVYFDTRDHALRADGLSLAVRQSADGWVQTLACEQAQSIGAPGRLEAEAAVDANAPELGVVAGKALRHKLVKAAGHARLAPVFEVTIARTTRGLVTASGDEITLVLDKGQVTSGRRKEGFHQARLTLKSGNPIALSRLASHIADGGPLELSAGSLADRGYRLADPRRPTPHVPVKARSSPVDPEMTAGEAMSAICGAAIAHIQQNWRAVAEIDDPEAVHQLRVGLRRLRSALRIMRGAVDDPGLRAFDEKARDLSTRVGRLRDVDVLLGDIVTPLAGTSQVAKGISVLRRNLSRERVAMRSQVRDWLATKEAGLLRLELVILPHIVMHLARGNAKQLDEPVSRFAHRALRKLHARVVKRGKRLDELTIEERHELRKAMKSLRYGIDFFAPLYPAREVRRLLAAASDLQDVLGYLNDVALAAGLMTFPSREAARAAEVAHATGAVIGWHAAQAEHAWISAKSAWKHFHREAELIE